MQGGQFSYCLTYYRLRAFGLAGEERFRCSHIQLLTPIEIKRVGIGNVCLQKYPGMAPRLQQALESRAAPAAHTMNNELAIKAKLLRPALACQW